MSRIVFSPQKAIGATFADHVQISEGTLSYGTDG
jgi:hypothetical protein